MSRIETMKPTRVFLPFTEECLTRLNDEERIIEGYAFVNEVVPGENGVRLKRTAMEKASDGYMQWGAIREMHEPKAAGTCKGLQWDKKGAKMVVRVVDNDAWNKVKEGVYKGLSIGVRPLVVRGKDVESCEWLETSLVDRPGDPDAIITLARADQWKDVENVMAKEFSVVRLPKSDKDKTKKSTETPSPSGTEGHAALIERVASLETQYADLLKRFETVSAPASDLLTRLEFLNKQVKAQKKEIKRLAEQPVKPIQMPVRYPQGLERSFAANDQNGQEPSMEQIEEEFVKRMQTLQKEAQEETNPAKRVDLARQVSVLKQQAAQYGVNLT